MTNSDMAKGMFLNRVKAYYEPTTWVRYKGRECAFGINEAVYFESLTLPGDLQVGLRFDPQNRLSVDIVHSEGRKCLGVFDNLDDVVPAIDSAVREFLIVY